MKFRLEINLLIKMITIQQINANSCLVDSFGVLSASKLIHKIIHWNYV